jgi:hypothetical protein
MGKLSYKEFSNSYATDELGGSGYWKTVGKLLQKMKKLVCSNSKSKIKYINDKH